MILIEKSSFINTIAFIYLFQYNNNSLSTYLSQLDLSLHPSW
jgi:hypothetical protein